MRTRGLDAAGSAAVTSHCRSAHAEMTSSVICNPCDNTQMVLCRHVTIVDFLLFVGLQLLLGAIYVSPISSFRRSFADTDPPKALMNQKALLTSDPGAHTIVA